MKKILFAIFGAALLLCASCQEQNMQIEQIPYRQVIEYTPGTYTMEVSGTVVAGNYDWISFTQSGNTLTYTVTRNTKDAIRRAEFPIQGTDEQVVISQKAHALDASLTTTVAVQGATSATFQMALTTKYGDDYASWGIIYGTESDMSKGKNVPQKGLAVGKNFAEIEGLVEGADYFIWSYVVSTEGDVIYSSACPMIAPVFVRAGESLQKAIDNAKEFQEIRVLGGLTFNGNIDILDANKNKALSGGWNEDFTEQSMDNLTIIDGEDANYGIFCAADKDDNPLQGYFEVSYFGFTRCKGGHGPCVHICGGPLTVHHCKIYNNTQISSKGAIGTREEDFGSDLIVYNCIFEGNIADGHGACLGLGDGEEGDIVTATVVNNLFINNRSESFGGYASIFICYNHTELVFVNNTVVNNFNYMDGDDKYSGMMFRGNTRNLIANNIIVGNTLSEDNLEPPVEFPHPNYINLGGSYAVLANNIIESDIKENQNMTSKDNQMFDAGFDYSKVISNDYQPLGSAIGAGTLGEYTITFNSGLTNTVSVENVLAKYDTDLAGNPRVVNGKVDLGCYQTK